MKYSKDPKWITARFKSKCSDCNETINTGDTIFYYPIGKHVSCESCGEAHSKDFESCKADEDSYNGTGNPYASF